MEDQPGLDTAPSTPTTAPAPAPAPTGEAGPGTGTGLEPSPRGAIASLREFVTLLRSGDDAGVENAVVQLSRSRRWLAPVALVVGAVLMLFQGLKMLFANGRLTLVQVLPAMWIWAAMLNLKIHLLRGRSFHVLRGPILVPLVLAIAGITAASFFLNAVFAFAIAKPGKPQIRPAFGEARQHMAVVLSWGFGIGLALAFSTTVVTRWGRWPFAISLSIVVAIMMICYLAVPARLIGVKPTYSRRDKLTASAIGGALGAVVCSPPYLLGRVGILLLGAPYLFVPGVILLIIGVTLQTGATTAVKSIKMSAKLVAGHHEVDATPAGPD